MSKPKVYFACSITGNEDFRQEKLGAVIERLEQEGFDVVQPPLTTTSDCYLKDLELIDESAGVIYYLPKPSTGMGMEMYYGRHSGCTWGWAFEGEDDAISPFVRGFCEEWHVPIVYGVDELVRALKESLIL